MATVTALAKLLAVCVAIAACVLTALALHAIDSSYLAIFASKLNATHFNPMPTHSPCDANAVQPKFSNPFWAHMYYMSLAFGFFAPIAAVSYGVFRDMLGVPQYAAKVIHGLLMLGSLICSILGYQQIYYAHGASCNDAGGKHFQSTHSYVGIVVLASWWFQWPSALAVFSNTRLLVPGTLARATFLRYHAFAGTLLVGLGLMTLYSGMMLFDGKRPVPPPVPEKWWSFARAGTAAFVTLVLFAWYVFESKSAPLGSTQTKPQSEALMPALDSGSDGGA